MQKEKPIEAKGKPLTHDERKAQREYRMAALKARMRRDADRQEERGQAMLRRAVRVREMLAAMEAGK